MQWPSLPGGLGVLNRRIEIDWRRCWRLIRDHAEMVLLGLGVLLRVGVYLRNRAFWLDEGSLFGNLNGKPILDFSTPLTGDQLAPFGFLIAERALLSVLGSSRGVARLVPLICGIAALFLFARLARAACLGEPPWLR